MATIIDGVKTLQIRNAKNGDFDLNLEGCDCAYLESLIYNAYPSESETGNPIYFDDGADSVPVKELIVNLEPKQDLKGYDHPWIGGGGVNKLNLAEMSSSGISYGLTISIDGEDFVFSGTYNGTISNPQFRFAYYTDQREIPYKCKGFAVDATTADHFTGAIGRADSNKTLTISLNNMVQGETYNFRVRVVAYEGDTAPTEWSPYSNICPISGFDGVKVKRTGKNLIDGTAGNVGAINNAGSIMSNWTDWHYQRVKVNAGDELVLSGVTQYVSGNATHFRVLDKNGSLLSVISKTNSGYPLTVPSGAEYVEMCWQNADNGTVQLELGSTATEYEPYVGQEYSITFPVETGTVYGGRLNVTTGVLTVDKTMVTVDGNSNISSNGTKPYGGLEISHTPSPSKAYGAPYSYSDLISNRFTVNPTSQSNPNTMNGRTTNGNVYFNMPAEITTVELAESWFTDNPTQVVYKLETPATVQLTPTEVSTLLGSNTISSDGSMELEYRADTTKVIEKLTNAIISLGGNV